MSDSEVTLDIKKLTLLHELMATQLELMVNEQVKQREMLDNLTRRLDSLRELSPLVRALLENQTRR